MEPDSHVPPPAELQAVSGQPLPPAGNKGNCSSSEKADSCLRVEPTPCTSQKKCNCAIRYAQTVIGWLGSVAFPAFPPPSQTLYRPSNMFCLTSVGSNSVQIRSVSVAVIFEVINKLWEKQRRGNPTRGRTNAAERHQCRGMNALNGVGHLRRLDSEA